MKQSSLCVCILSCLLSLIRMTVITHHLEAWAMWRLLLSEQITLSYLTVSAVTWTAVSEPLSVLFSFVFLFHFLLYLLIYLFLSSLCKFFLSNNVFPQTSCLRPTESNTLVFQTVHDTVFLNSKHIVWVWF